MTAYEAMSAGAHYDAGDPDLVSRRKAAQRRMKAYNDTILGDPRDALLDDLLGTANGVVIRPPFHVDYGTNIHFGTRCFVNYGAVFLDVCPIRIGGGTQLGPYVQILTADHPRDPQARADGLEMGRPITIGDNVWIGGGAILLPGVRIGDNAIIGAGAVVTRDVAESTTVGGNPARPLHPSL